MSVSLATKLHWFDRGARAFAATLKLDAPATDAPRYVCPLCIKEAADGRLTMTMFRRVAVEVKALTAEHVPPEGFAGRELVLTCGPCNHTAGARLDAEARKREMPGEVLTGRAHRPAAVRLTAGGHTIPALMSSEGRTFTLKMPKHFKRPLVTDGFLAAIHHDNEGNRDIHVNFSGDAFRERHANLSFLRAAYLALFAVAGYRYIFRPELAIVRRQIAEPDIEHIPTFMITLPHDPPWTERRLVRVKAPEDLQCWAVMIGRYAVFLPLPGDPGFYARLDEARRARAQAAKRSTQIPGALDLTATGDSFEFPTRPTFGVPDEGRDSRHDEANRPPD